MELLSKYKGSYLSYFLMYNFYYLSWALFSVLISVYLLDKGFKPSEVSLVVSISFFTSMIAQPAIGVLSDKIDTKIVNTILFVLAGLGGVYFIFATSLLEVTIGYSFVLTLINGTNPLMEKIATTSKYAYGKIRIWGTIGYALGTQLAGLIYELISPTAIFILFVITMMITILGLLGTENSKNSKVTTNKRKTSRKGYVSQLFGNKKYLYYLIIVGLFFGTSNIGHTYTSAMLQNDGLQISFVSTILSIAVICEAPIVLLSSRFMDKLSNKRLLIIAFTLMIFQTMIYGLNLGIPMKILATLLFKHPPSMLFIMINLKVINTLIDEEYQITALALVQTIRNVFSIILQNIAGYILDFTTYQHLFIIISAILMFGLVLVLFFKIPSGKNKKLFT